MKNSILFLALLFIPTAVHAEDVSVYLSIRQESTAAVLTVYGVVSTPINALEGTIFLPRVNTEEFLWDDSESPVRMWIKTPEIVNGILSFAGIIPGGLATTLGAPIPLLRIFIPIASASDFSGASIRSFSAYLHQQVPQLAGIAIRTEVLFEDLTGEPLPSNAPDAESLDIELIVSRFTEIASGAPVALFSPVSRGVLSDRTMIRERFLGIFGSWRTAQSPYILRDKFGLSIVDLQVSTTTETRIITEIPIRLYALWSILGVVLIYTLFRRVF